MLSIHYDYPPSGTAANYLFIFFCSLFTVHIFSTDYRLQITFFLPFTVYLFSHRLPITDQLFFPFTVHRLPFTFSPPITFFLPFTFFPSFTFFPVSCLPSPFSFFSFQHHHPPFCLKIAHPNLVYINPRCKANRVELQLIYAGMIVIIDETGHFSA